MDYCTVRVPLSRFHYTLTHVARPPGSPVAILEYVRTSRSRSIGHWTTFPAVDFAKMELHQPLVARTRPDDYEELARTRSAPLKQTDLAKRRRKAPWRAILFAAGLLLLGSVLLIVGALMAVGIIMYLLSTAIALIGVVFLAQVPCKLFCVAKA